MSSSALRASAVLAALGAALLPGGARGSEEPAPHPLMAAAEAVCQAPSAAACDTVLRAAESTPGLTTAESITLLWWTARRGVDGGNASRTRDALARIVELDAQARPPRWASAKLQEAWAEALATAPPRAPGAAATGAGAPPREPELVPLVRAAEALLDALEYPGLALVVDTMRAVPSSTPAMRAQVSVWLGILKMEKDESPDEAGARALFDEALALDREVEMPEKAQTITRGVFLDVKKHLPPPPAPVPAEAVVPRLAATATTPPSLPPPRAPDSSGWLIGGGIAGAVLTAGGVVAGLIARQKVGAEQDASARGDYPAYLRNRDDARLAVRAAWVLYASGGAAAAIGATGYFLSGPRPLRVSAGVGPGAVSLQVHLGF